MVEEVIAASTSPDAAFKWIQLVGKKGTTFDELKKSYLPFSGPPTLYGTLDAKLAAAVTRIISGDFARKVQLGKLKAFESKGYRLAGRQLLSMTDEHFRMSEADGAVYDMEHLLNVKLRNDNLDKFMVDWETVLSRIKTDEQPGDVIKHTLVLRELRESHALRDHIRD